jgi:hypothetical protein
MSRCDRSRARSCFLPHERKAFIHASSEAAKKSAKHHDPKHDSARDLRRAHEHLDRVHILQSVLQPKQADDVKSLVTLAEQKLENGHRKDAANLLRAAEHFSFAALAYDTEELEEISKALTNVLSDRVRTMSRPLS